VVFMKRRKLTARTALTFIWIIFNLQVFCYAGFISSGNTKYYVDSIDGNDSAYGTSPQEAWRTLTKVNDTTFAAGDQILFRAGCSWDGQLLLKGSGTASNPISVNMYGTGNKPIINAGGTTANDAAAVRLKNQQYWEINNLEITHTNGSTGYQGDLWAIRVIVDNGTEINHIYIRDCYIHHVNGDVATKTTGGIYVTADGTNPAWYNDLKIQNNTITNTGGLGIATQSPHGKFSAPVRYPYLNVLISGNTVGPTGRNNMIIRVSDDAIVEHNRFIDSSIHDKGHSVFCFNTDNIMIQYNEAYGNVGPVSQTDRGGFDVDYNCKNTKIQYNYSHDNNWFCGIMKTGFNENVVIRYNISENDKEAIYFYGFETATGPQGCQVYNNTHYIASTVTGVEVFRERTARNTDFYNNIFHFEGSGSWGTGNPVNCTFENNCYYNISPKGTNFITANPQFVNPGTGGYDIDWSNYPLVLTGYQLQSTSPCIDAGRTVISNGGQDFWGNALYNGAPDIGAHEYSPDGPAESPRDLNGDGFIGWGDVMLISATWVLTGPGILGDINGDGTVDFLDFAEFALAW